MRNVETQVFALRATLAEELEESASHHLRNAIFSPEGLYKHLAMNSEIIRESPEIANKMSPGRPLRTHGFDLEHDILM